MLVFSIVLLLTAAVAVKTRGDAPTMVVCLIVLLFAVDLADPPDIWKSVSTILLLISLLYLFVTYMNSPKRRERFRRDKQSRRDLSVRTYQKSLDQVFAAAQKTVRDLEYKVDLMDKANGLLNFKTGLSWNSWAGQEMSVMMIDNGDATVEVCVTGRRNQSGVLLQVWDWDEAKGIATKVFAKLDEYLQ